jgi:hypothetical protein
MALERPPSTSGSTEALKSYRPDPALTARIHVVKDQSNRTNPTEDLTTVARANGVDVLTLIGFNFPGAVVNSKVVPEIVNWYLFHHHEFGCPNTRNGLNRMFRGGERLYIPKATEPDPPGKGPLPKEVEDRLKVSVEVFELPWVEIKGVTPWVRWKVSGTVKGKIAFWHAEHQTKANVAKWREKIALEFSKKLEDGWEEKFSFKFDHSKLLKAKKPGDWLQVFDEMFSYSRKKEVDLADHLDLFHKLDRTKVKFSFEYGGQLSWTPIFAKIGLEFAPYVFKRKDFGIEVVVAGTGDFKVAIGPGPQLVAYAIEYGLPVGVVLVVSGALFAGFTEIVRGAARQGVWEGCRSWYGAGYVRTIFPQSYRQMPDRGPIYDLMMTMYKAGQTDAMADARRMFGGPDPVGAYRNLLMSMYAGKPDPYRMASEALLKMVNEILARKAGR